MTLDKWLKRVDATYGHECANGTVRVPHWVMCVCRESYFLGKKAGRAEECRKLSKRIGVKP